jgi:hypothetical protein
MALWRKMEAEGRLRLEAMQICFHVGATEWWTLRLNPDEMERLRYQPRQVHTNLEALGES